jgi:hypothetical protein
MTILADGGRIQNRVRLENLQEHQYNTLVSILSYQWKGLLSLHQPLQLIPEIPHYIFKVFHPKYI